MMRSVERVVSLIYGLLPVRMRVFPVQIRTLAEDRGWRQQFFDAVGNTEFAGIAATVGA